MLVVSCHKLPAYKIVPLFVKPPNVCLESEKLFDCVEEVGDRFRCACTGTLLMYCTWAIPRST